jgi:hypothetical protein
LFRGHQGIEKYIAILDDVEESNHLVAQEFVTQGDTVSVFGEYVARVNCTGIQFKTDFVHVFKLRDGKVVRFRYFYDTAATAAAFENPQYSVTRAQAESDEKRKRGSSERRPNTRRDGFLFEPALVDAVWEKALPVEGYRYMRKDRCGALICRENFGSRESLGWEIDHIVPVSMGGGDDLDNLQPLQWQNNESKGDNYPDWECKNTG